MSRKDLHAVANRILRQADLLDGRGLLVRSPADIEFIACNVRNLRIVGSEPKGKYQLPARKKGFVKLDEGLIVVQARLLDDPDFDVEFREVVAHEVAHDVLHSSLLDQQTLPFSAADSGRSLLRKLTFSRDRRNEIEREAIYLAALLQIPSAHLVEALRSVTLAYHEACLSRPYEEDEVAMSYSQSSVMHLSSIFEVSGNTARLVLDYFGALERPPREWISPVGLGNLSQI